MDNLNWLIDLGRITDPHWWFAIGMVRLIRYGNRLAGVR